MMLGREKMYASIAEIPAIKRGMVWCTVCGHSRRLVDDAVRIGWPLCCGYTMTIDSPEERGILPEPLL
jgi:hypothetical protein